MSPHLIRNVSVISTGSGAAHAEHLYGTSKPSLWWIFTSQRWVPVPVNVYVVEHADGLVLFDTGADPAAASDPDYWPDPVTALFARHLFRWKIGPDDALARQLENAGYAGADVVKAVLSHLHFDHAGGIGDIPNAELYVTDEPWVHMLGPHPEREMVLRRHIAVLGSHWRPITFQPTSDPALAPFRAAFDLMGDGSMMVLPTPGHLPGCVSMLVRRADAAPLLLVGDLTYAAELLERDQLPATGDADLLRESFANVRALRQHMPDLVILPAHDPNAAARINSASTKL